MTIVIGNGTITGISAGGLNNGIITGSTVADGNITTDRLVSSLYTNSKSANGYTYLPNGVLIQWGTFATSGTTYTLTYPIAFPSACTFVLPIRYAAGDTGGVVDIALVAGASATLGLSSQVFSTVSGWSVYWIAIGY